jgi:hypothetical protein
MSDTPSNESHEQKPKAKSFEKLTMFLAASALLLTLVNTVLIAMNPTAKKVEQFNEELKTELPPVFRLPKGGFHATSFSSGCSVSQFSMN